MRLRFIIAIASILSAFAAFFYEAYCFYEENATQQPPMEHAAARIVPAILAPTRRIPVHDVGIIFRHGLGPDNCDKFCAREAIIAQENGVFHLFYDGIGPRGVVACLATSTTLMHWERRGPILDLGKPGEPDLTAACSPWVIRAGDEWQMFYLGTRTSWRGLGTQPYVVLRATAPHLAGPWTKRPDLPGLVSNETTWQGASSSPGQVVRTGTNYLMFFSGSHRIASGTTTTMWGGPHYWEFVFKGAARTIGIAYTRDLSKPWKIAPRPILPATEQIENSSLYFEPENGYWFLFTNHVGQYTPDAGSSTGERTESIWVYWTKNLTEWNRQDKAVVLDGEKCRWSHRIIGMPTVIRIGDRLAMLYDGKSYDEKGRDESDDLGRDIGLAWLDLPMRVP